MFARYAHVYLLGLLLVAAGCRSAGDCNRTDCRPPGTGGAGEHGSPCPPGDKDLPACLQKMPPAGDAPKRACVLPEPSREIVHRVQVEVVPAGPALAAAPARPASPPAPALAAAPPALQPMAPQLVALQPTPTLAAVPGLPPVQPAGVYPAVTAASAPTLGLRLDWLRLPIPFPRPVLLPGAPAIDPVPLAAGYPAAYAAPAPAMLVQQVQQPAPAAVMMAAPPAMLLQQPAMLATPPAAILGVPAAPAAAAASPCVSAEDLDRVTAEVLRQKREVELRIKALEK